MKGEVLPSVVLTDRLSPVAAVLTIVGGGFILAGGLVLFLLGTALARVVGLSNLWFVGGVVIGLVTIVAGVLIWVVPPARRALGMLALICAALSIPLAFGGFVLGFGLAAAGGAVALVSARRREPLVTSATPSGPSPPWT